MPEMLQRVSGGKRRQTIDKVAVVRGRGEQGASWKVMENAGERPVQTKNVEYFCQERARVKRFREEAEEEVKAGIRGQWQLESPASGMLQ